MSEFFTWVLGIATILGGIAAIGYFRDQWLDKQQWLEKEKQVNNAWWESCELKKEYQARGCKDFTWSNSDRVAARVQDGMSVVYEIDEKNRTKYRLVNRSGQVLLCRSGV